MSYARFSDDSDVYVFLDVGGFLSCCGCSLGPNPQCSTTAEMLAHLDEHEAAGHTVPQSCRDDLLAEAEENDREIAEYLETGLWPS